jgi:L,D-peptidoglycan transpeptidase YkuD (ErfK/YbiS/YcfS/YnhG family)
MELRAVTDLLIEAEPGATTGWARFGALQLHCALGHGGIAAAKTEGDGCTPAGRFPVRELMFRPDRVREIRTALATRPLSPADGWCDDPADPGYNRLVTRPYPARHEQLWRDDQLYDLLLVIGHNDDPVVPGLGSAVFLHLAHPDYRPTEGCVAFGRADFIALLAAIQIGTPIVIGA